MCTSSSWWTVTRIYIGVGEARTMIWDIGKNYWNYYFTLEERYRIITKPYQYFRLSQVGLSISRPPAAVARYTMIKHVKRQPLVYKVRSKLVRTSKRRYRLDGLNTLRYHLINITSCHLYTNILVDVGKTPKSIDDLQQEYEKSRNRKGRNNITRHWFSIIWYFVILFAWLHVQVCIVPFFFSSFFPWLLVIGFLLFRINLCMDSHNSIFDKYSLLFDLFRSVILRLLSFFTNVTGKFHYMYCINY